MTGVRGVVHLLRWEKLMAPGWKAVIWLSSRSVVMKAWAVKLPGTWRTWMWPVRPQLVEAGQGRRASSPTVAMMSGSPSEELEVVGDVAGATPNSRRISGTRKATFRMWICSGRMWFLKRSGKTMMLSKAREPQMRVDMAGATRGRRRKGGSGADFGLDPQGRRLASAGAKARGRPGRQVVGAWRTRGRRRRPGVGEVRS